MLTKKLSMQEMYYTDRVSNAMYYLNLKGELSRRSLQGPLLPLFMQQLWCR